MHVFSAEREVAPEGVPVAAPSELAALAEDSMAAANAMAVLSAANDAVEAKQHALVTRLTQLEQSVTQRRARRGAEAAGAGGSRPSASGSAVSPNQLLSEETQDVTCMVEDMVSQVNCTVRPLFLHHAAIATTCVVLRILVVPLHQLPLCRWRQHGTWCHWFMGQTWMCTSQGKRGTLKLATS